MSTVIQRTPDGIYHVFLPEDLGVASDRQFGRLVEAAAFDDLEQALAFVAGARWCCPWDISQREDFADEWGYDRDGIRVCDPYKRAWPDRDQDEAHLRQIAAGGHWDSLPADGD